MPQRTDGRGAHRQRTAGRSGRCSRVLRLLSAISLGVALLGVVAQPAAAVQASGDDAASWATGWSWTYATTFRYVDASSSTDVTVNENVTYTNAGPTTYNGQSAYRVDLTGTITGGSGSTQTSQGKVTLKSFSGTVSGFEYVRRSDLALLQENQHQDLRATASLSIISVGITAVIDLTLTPTPGWKALAFPLNAGDSWHEHTDVAYTGGFNYDAGSLGGTGSSPFDGNVVFDAPATATAATIAVPVNGALPTDAVAAANADASMVDNQWWSPGYKNVAREHLQVPLDTASLTIDRSLSAASTPAPAIGLTAAITPSLTCAGAPVTVAGRLSSGAAGVPLTVTLDQAADTVGKKVTATATTGSNGAYSATLASPGETDRLAKNGARAGWGVLVDGGGATAVATLVVTNQDCTSLSYTGATSGPVGTPGTVSAKLVDLVTGEGVSGQPISFALSGGTTGTATTGADGVATATVPLNQPVRTATVTATFPGSATLTAAAATGSLAIGKDPTTTTVGSATPLPTIGDPVTFTANVIPTVGSGPTGAVQFAVDGQNFGAPVTIDAGGHATSAAISTLTLGDHAVTAAYLGDATFAGSTSSSYLVHVHNPLTPTTAHLDVSPNPSVYGQPVTLTATVAPRTGTGTPTGAVRFSDGGTELATVALSNAGGGNQAVLTTSELSVGTHAALTAAYLGDDDYEPVIANTVSQVVVQANTSTAVVASDSATVAGQPVSYSASVSVVAPGSGQPDGTAQLRIDGIPEGDPVTLSGGVAIFPPHPLDAGSHTVTVAYSGSGNHAGSVGSTTQNVAKAATTTSLTASPSPSAQDQDVTLTATVVPSAPASGTPSGPVVFTVDGTDIGVAQLSTSPGGARAVLVTSALAPGAHSITARYPGDANYLGATSEVVSQTVIEGAAVTATTTTLESSVNPSTFGQPITFTATVAATGDSVPQGSVQFAVDGTNVGDPAELDNGVAVGPVLASPHPGDHFVTAAYLPTAAFAASGAGLTQTVSGAGVDVALTSSDDRSDFGQGVTFHVQVASTQAGTGVPRGVVQFRVDGVALGSAVPLDSGAADSPSRSDLAPGTHTVTVLYGGSVDFLPGSAGLAQTVDLVATTTSVVSSVNPSTYGQSVTLNATVTPASAAFGPPGGTVTFTDGTTTLGSAPVGADGDHGIAALTVSTLTAGTHLIRARYSGSSVFDTSTSAALSQSVAKAPTSIIAEAAVLKLSPLGLPLGTLRATLVSPYGPGAGQPLAFTIGAVSACTVTTDENGHAVCNALKYVLNLTLALGYRVTFAGDANHLPSTATAGLIK